MRLYSPDPLTGDDNMPSVDAPDNWEWIGEDGLTDSGRVLAETVMREEELPGKR